MQPWPAQPVPMYPLGPPPRPNRSLPILIVALSLCAIALVVVAALWRKAESDAAHIDAKLADVLRGSAADRDQLATLTKANADRAELLDLAEQYAVEFSSYDYRTLDAQFALVQSHMTKEFAKSYTSITQTLRPTLLRVHGVAKAEVVGAGLAEYDPTSARATIFLNQSVTNLELTTPRVDRNRLILTLKRVGDDWLISDVTII